MAFLQRWRVDAIVPSLTTLFSLSLTFPGSLPVLFQFLNQRFWLLPPTTVPSSSCLLWASSWSAMPCHVHQILFDFLCTNYPLSMRKLGSRCTTSALLTVMHDWLQQLEVGNDVCSTFDLKKAFNRVPHCLLQSHTLYTGSKATLPTVYRLLLVASSHLPCLVISRVPQGSILGPLLFLVFISQSDLHGQ